MIKTKSVHSAIDPKGDGLRILVTRFRGRGLPTDRYDVWMANLGPSEGLLKGFLKGKSSWREFAKAYRSELIEGGSIDKRNPTIKNHGQKFTLRLLQKLGEKGTITLMCHCAEEEQHCHRHVLKELLERKV